MINSDISKRVLVIGPMCGGKGGVAQLIYTSSQLYSTFRFIGTMSEGGKLSKLWVFVAACIKLIYFCIFGGVKIVHIHTASYNSFYRKSILLLIAKLFGKKVILHAHSGYFGDFYYKNRKYCNFIIKRADVVVCVSEYLKHLYVTNNLNSNIKVIYNAIDEPLYDKIVNTSSVKEILFMGAIDENKGIFNVAETFGKYKEKLSDRCHLTICGVGQSDRLLNIIDKYGLNDLIKYEGWVDKEAKHRLLSKSDIYIQPSTFESLGISILEAMSYKIAVIGSNTGGIPELIDDNKNGFLIEVGDFDTLVDKILYLIDNLSIRERVGELAKRKSELFSLKAMESNLIKFYIELTD